MARGRRMMGTNIRRELDVYAIGEGLARPGMDTRSWVEYGTVASVGGADGKPDFTDGNAIVISPDGIDVDVVLGTSQSPVTCRYGHQAGDVFLLFPIRPGDHVEVVIPRGDLGAGPSITKVLSGPHTQLPIEDGDRKPVFRNDRALFFAKNVPIELRTAGGARLVMGQDGSITMNQGAEQAVRGTTYRANEAQMNSDLATALGAWAAAATAMTPPDIAVITALAATVGAFLTAAKVFAPLWLQALQAFEAQSGSYLSDKVKLT